MLFKGNKCRQVVRVGEYLGAQGKNDRIEFIGTRGTLASDIQGAVLEMKGLALGSRAKKAFFFVSMNLAKGEYLSPEQWEHAWAIYEKNQELEGHQRIIVQHEKEGRVHQHALYNRVSPDTMKAAPMSNDYYKNEMTRSQLEKEFGFTTVRGRLFLNENERPANRSPTYNEIIQGKINGVNVRNWREESRQIMAEREGLYGIELIAAFEEKGHMVARGLGCDLVLLDPSGTPHNLVKTLNLRVRNGEFNARFGHGTLANLPSIEQAQEMQNSAFYRLETVKKAEENCNSSHTMVGMHDHGDIASQLLDVMYHAIDRYNARHQVRPIKWIKQHRETTNLIRHEIEKFTYSSYLPMVIEPTLKNIHRKSNELNFMVSLAKKRYSNNMVTLVDELTDEQKNYYHKIDKIKKKIELDKVKKKILIGKILQDEDFKSLIINDIENIWQHGQEYFNNIFVHKNMERSIGR